MDNRIYAVVIVLAVDMLVPWFLWSKLSGYFLKKDSSAFQVKLIRFVGMPVLASICLLLVFGSLENLVTGSQATHFLDHLFRFALVTMTIFMGIYGLLHTLLVWPQRSENGKSMRFFFYLAAVPALIFFALGILLLVKFFQFS